MLPSRGVIKEQPPSTSTTETHNPHQTIFNPDAAATFVSFGSVDQAGPLQAAGRVREGHQARVGPPQRGDFVSHLSEGQLGRRQGHWWDQGDMWTERDNWTSD